MSNQHKNHLTQLLLIKSIKHLSQQARLFSKCNGVYNRSQRWHSSGLKYMFNMVLHLQLLHSSKYSFNTGASVCSQRLLLRRQQSVSSLRSGRHSTGVQTSALQTMVLLTGKRDNVTVLWLLHNQLSLFLLHEALPQKLQVRQEHKELATPNSHRHDNLYIFKIYTVFLSFLGSLIIFNYAKLLTKLPWRVKPEYHCFNCLSGPVFQNLPTKWRKQAQKSSNIWHKPSRRCLRGPLDIFSSPGQTRLRTVRPQSAAGRHRWEEHKLESREESTQLSRHCPAGRLFPSHTGAGHAHFGTGSQSVGQFWNSELIRWKGRGNDGPGLAVFWGSSFTVVQLKKLLTQLWVQQC